MSTQPNVSPRLCSGHMSGRDRYCNHDELYEFPIESNIFDFKHGCLALSGQSNIISSKEAAVVTEHVPGTSPSRDQQDRNAVNTEGGMEQRCLRRPQYSRRAQSKSDPEGGLVESTRDSEDLAASEDSTVMSSLLTL
jgi:hypothetical protein